MGAAEMVGSTEMVGDRLGAAVGVNVGKGVPHMHPEQSQPPMTSCAHVTVPCCGAGLIIAMDGERRRVRAELAARRRSPFDTSPHSSHVLLSQASHGGQVPAAAAVPASAAASATASIGERMGLGWRLAATN